MTYRFGPFELDAPSLHLSRDGGTIRLSDRHLELLLQLVFRAGQVVSKDALIASVWQDVAVTDNSLEQAISTLRRTLGDAPPGAPPYIETHARRGYRFAGVVTITDSRSSDDALAAVLAPYRALVEGRAALETLDREAITRACRVFEEITRSAPDYAPAHLGLANALALAVESVRAARPRDTSAITRALHHASEACRLDPTSGEAWATLSLLCHQSRDDARAIASGQRAAALEPDNWRHHLRLAYVSWGEPRLRAAQRVLKLMPGFPLAHWLAATVHVARQAFDKAEHELVAGAASQDQQPMDAPFKGVGLHLLLGLVRLAGDDEDGAIRAIERELEFEGSRHIYSREACANSWCALAAIHLRHSRTQEARAAFERALAAIPGHAVALAAMSLPSVALDQAGTRQRVDEGLAELQDHGTSMDATMARAVAETLIGNPGGAARLSQSVLESLPGGSAGWSIPVEPLLHVNAHAEQWKPVLTLLRSRAM